MAFCQRGSPDIKAKAKGGSNRIGNLTLACPECNKAKGTQDIQDFLAGKPELLRAC
ncbi:MAG: HNH endonuclease [Microcystis aeruginosa LG13-12]|jgi:5-methylcytosine-specific restriction endonuclease McrA|nr:HNH endonuclease [Microcystis aeruginosa LG13-12]